jgi:hypothetical protein
MRYADQSENVSWRRGGDKLNHFMRWCERMTDGMTKREALALVRGVTPRNLIGDHAYGHWEGHLEYGHSRRRTSYLERGQRRVQSYVDSTTFHLTRALAIDPNVHSRLNAAIKARKATDEIRRMLGGIHDVASFVRTIAKSEYAEAWPSYSGPDPYVIEREETSKLIEGTERAAENGPPFYFQRNRFRIRSPLQRLIRGIESISCWTIHGFVWTPFNTHARSVIDGLLFPHPN